ncbi:MAG: N-acylglucosamine 2-epimerase [Chitinophagaceae bacterium]|nr:MAG: N-acylglucosamine 2-epimerase [Chitinophagaceae bacterium]
MKKIIFFPVLLFCFELSAQQKDRQIILTEMRTAAKELLIENIYPRNIDTAYGGYLSSFTYDFKPYGDQDKMIVTQARHVWSTAKAAEFFHDTSYIAMARHGFHFLRDKMWDKEQGGFYTLVNRAGEPKTPNKEAYGNSFAIYGLSAYYAASKDEEALELAKKGFQWLEQHSHDPVHKGYFQHLERNGTPIVRPANTPGTSDLGYKDQNSSIHLLEALTELYSVWKDPVVKERLQEMLLLIRDTMVSDKGYLRLFFYPDWKPVSNRDSSRAIILERKGVDHVSFGHDVETAFLMMEASEALGIEHDQRTWDIGKKMVDHSLATGWDDKIGGFYDEGYYFKDAGGKMEIIRNTKNWWAQSEGLNTLMIFSEIYPNDKHNYFAQFKKLWNYSNTYLIDHKYGDWYEYGIDGSPKSKTALKAHIWKGTYHSFRSLMNCIKRLEKKG